MTWKRKQTNWQIESMYCVCRISTCLVALMIGGRRACRCITTSEKVTLSESCVCGVWVCLVVWLIEGQRRRTPGLLHSRFHVVLLDLGHCSPRRFGLSSCGAVCTPSTRSSLIWAPTNCATASSKRAIRTINETHEG